MADDQKPNEEARRFRIARKVKSQEIKTHAEQALEEVDVDDADKGTPAENASLRRGCGSCLNVTLLFFVVMFLSIIGSCYINWN